MLRVVPAILLLLPGSSPFKWPPIRLRSENYYWPDFLAQRQLVYLTEEILKDVELKMVIIQYIQQSYYQSFDYEVGYMSSAVKDLFKNMLNIYTAYCQPSSYANKTTNSADYLDLLHRVQGDYREILMYRDMYVKAAEEEAKRQKKAVQIARFKEMRKKTQLNLKESEHRDLSREAETPHEHRRPPQIPKYEQNKRTLKPWQSKPLDSKEWEALQKEESPKGLRVRNEKKTNKKQAEENYKALLRENFHKARRAEPPDAAF